MNRTTLAVAILLASASHVVVRADVTITITNEIEGPVAAALAGSGVMPTMTIRVKDLKARNDMDTVGRRLVTIADVAGRQLLMLDETDRTVRRIPFAELSALTATAGGLNVTMPKMDFTVQPTGRTETMAGQSCEEFRLVMTMDLSQVGAALANPDARDAVKDMRMVMSGSTWIARSSPAASEFVKYLEAARAAGMANLAGLLGSQGGTDPIAQTMARAEGLPCFSEIAMTYEGTSPMIDVLKQMGAMKVRSRLTAISLDPIDAELFVVPAGYQEAPAQSLPGLRH